MRSYHSFGNWILFISLTLIWGSSYILIKKGLHYFAPVDLAAIRICFSALFVLPFLGTAWKNTPAVNRPWVAAIGLAGSGIPAFLFAVSVGRLGSSVNGILNALSPLFTLLLGIMWFNQKATTPQFLGVGIGLFGAIVLNIRSDDATPFLQLWYAVLPIGATFCYGLSSNITRYRLNTLQPLYATTLAMQFIGIPCFLYLILSGQLSHIYQHPEWYPGLLYIGLLSLLGTVIAWSLFYRLVQQSDALFAASVTYVIPVVAMAWGYADGEILRLPQWIGMFLILMGVFFVSRKPTS